MSSEAGWGVFRTTPGVVLVLLMVLLTVASASFQRDVDQMSSLEVSYLLAAHSLAKDFDLSYVDEDRMRAQELSLSVENLAVSDSPEGEDRFDLPVAYPLILSPVVRLAPLRGPLIVNAVLMSLAVVLVAYRSARLLGRDALAMVAICIFASVVYRNVFLIQPTSLLVVIVALAFSLALRHEEPAAHGLQDVYRPAESPVGGGGRSLVIGALIGLAATHHLLFSLLVLPAAIAAPERRRRSSSIGLIAGLALVLLLSGVAAGGLPASVSSAWAASWGAGSVGTMTWNLLYLSVGRNTGLVPYFLPLLLLFGLWHGGSRRSVLALTILTGIVGFVFLQPFNYYAGPAAVGNAWAIPWLVLLLFLPTRPLPRGWLAVAALLAIPAMYPTWLAGGIEPVTDHGIYQHTAGRFHRYLPLETTQKELPPPGQDSGKRLWIRSMSREAEVGGSNRWTLAGQGWAELQIATPAPLRAVHLQFGSQAEPSLEVRGGDLGDTVLLPDGGIGFRIENLTRRALHPMWWSAERHNNYVLQLYMPGAASRSQTLTLTAIAEDVVQSQP